MFFIFQKLSDMVSQKKTITAIEDILRFTGLRSLLRADWNYLSFNRDNCDDFDDHDDEAAVDTDNMAAPSRIMPTLSTNEETDF